MTKRNIVILGISTGGPRVLGEIFDGLPVLNGSIVVVQHMLKIINGTLRTALDDLTKMDVRIASHGELITPGTVLIAPSEVHLELHSNQIIRLTNGPKVHYVRPSIDVTMKSVKRKPGDNIIGIIMTGMGKDGAEGISHIKSIGGKTFAQDEKTSTIWGMPKVAVETGHIDYVTTPKGIHNSLIARLGLLLEP